MNAPFKKNLLLLTLLAALPASAAVPAESPYSVPQPPFYGQLRPRTEFDSKDVRDTSINKGLLGTSLRSRIGFVAVPSAKTEIKIEFQDTRFWGSEPNGANVPHTATTGQFGQVDLLQGYFAIEEGPFKTAFGRQKMSLGAGRFLSTLEWNPFSRSFDGWSANLNLDPLNLTGLLFLVKDSTQATIKDRLLLSGLYASYQVNPDIVAEAYGFYDQSRLLTTVAGVTSDAYDLVYLGERVAGKLGPILFEEEFIWQMGDLRSQAAPLDRTSAAFQLATRLGYAFGANKINLGVDMMSGDDDLTDDEMTTYRANYYFAHAYYGWMDYFVTNPAAGVIDYRVDGEFPFWKNAAGNPRVTIRPQYHFFTPQKAPSATDDPYGQEINLEVHLGLYPKSNIVLGAGLFMPDKSAFRLAPAKITNSAFSDQPGMFLYFMPVFNF